MDEAIQFTQQGPVSWWVRPKVAWPMSAYPLTLNFISPYNRDETTQADGLKKVGDSGAKLLEGILSVPGVTNVSIRAWEMLIHITESYSFQDDIEPRVVAVFKKVYGFEEVRVYRRLK